MTLMLKMCGTMEPIHQMILQLTGWSSKVKKTAHKFHNTIAYNNGNVLFAYNADATGTNSEMNNAAMVQLKEINTLTRGKCFLLTPLIKAGKWYPTLILFMTTPPNE